MAAQNTFDIVSKIEMQEIDNAINQAMKEVVARFDFKGSNSKIHFEVKDKLILISDGIRAVGMPDGEYELGGLPVFAREGKVVLADGSLAGSLLTLDQAVRNMVKFTGMPLWKAVRMASLVPARRLGLDGDLGSLETGKRADLLVTDESCHVLKVWIRGKCVFDRETVYE